MTKQEIHDFIRANPNTCGRDIYAALNALYLVDDLEEVVWGECSACGYDCEDRCPRSGEPCRN